jgi:hypothetical protein
VAKCLVAIHQPNFLPWLGYFDKIRRADVFVFLDNVQFPKKGGTWINRVKIQIGGKPQWTTVPVVRDFSGVRRVDETEIEDSVAWRDKLIRTLQINYARAPFFSEVFPLIENVLRKPERLIADLNTFAIRELADAIGLRSTTFLRSSTLQAKGAATELLVNLVKEVGGTGYLCGGGAAGYQEDALFEAAGIELVYQNFQHPEYPQVGFSGFTPGLSVVDALACCGFHTTLSLLDSN